MCYTTTTHFNRCSHRTSAITPCPRSIYLRPTVYHPPTHQARPCGTNGREENILVQRDGLCEACSRVIAWYVGGGVGLDTGRKAESQRKSDRVPSAAQTAARRPQHRYATQGRAAPPPGPAQPTYPIPMGGEVDGRCPLSEAFERVVSIGGDGDARVDGSREVPGAVEGGPGLDGMRARRERGEYGPFRPPRFSDAGNGGHGSSPMSGMPSWSGGYGRRTGRRARRTAGKKQVRFAPKVEVRYFRGDWATTTLRSLGRGYKRHR